MLYFLTYSRCSIDKYNAVYDLGKYLTGHSYFSLTNDNRQPWKV